MGRKAAELLFARMESFDEPCERHVLASHLVQRGSGEIQAESPASEKPLSR
jgi:DNA-binding LacI/PurR family transcriptional regulator